ncbi:diacylglycerol kinase [Bowmanella dokdonensis]|uniref:Diacylglycerol kinase n=1 Tax=Bowmanella dokdonensis TaxID=751969 RepID=A0A939ISL1_9ALTE|nr:diacylglycerol kinase [Bowmanella dokdonensis]MBN7826847.1 diacylglycerol kinase [Bowmanella dokdonensis]
MHSDPTCCPPGDANKVVTVTGAASKAKGLTRLLRASVNSWHGLIWLSRHEAAFRQEVVLLGGLTPVSLLLEVSVMQHLALILSLLLVVLVEIINTAIEKVVDRISTEHHPLSGLAKDLGSAAVLVAMLMALSVWVTVLVNLWLTIGE